MKKNEWGYGAYEFLTVTVVCLMLATILTLTILKMMNSEKFQVLNYNAKIMGMNAIDYEVIDNSDTLYLLEMVEADLISPIKNPFASKEVCDLYESKVQFLDNEKNVRLQCGNYLVEQPKLSEDRYVIYRVSSWSSKKEEGSESRKVYNFADKKLKFADDYEEVLFIKQVNKKLRKQYQSLEEVKKEHKVASKTLYRDKVVLKKVDS